MRANSAMRCASGELSFPESGTLFELLSNILAPFEVEGRRQWQLHGDDPDIDGKKLTNLALLFHEFATNAARYGSLAVAEGRLGITASVKQDFLEIHWVESNGPRLSPDTGQETGFGNRLEQTVPQSLQVKITRYWQPDGLSIRLIVPAKVMAAG